MEGVPCHPGEILKYEFLEPLGMTAAELAAHIDVPLAEIEAFISEAAAVTPRMAWLLGTATGTGPELWMDMQTNHDLAKSRPKTTPARLVTAS